MGYNDGTMMVQCHVEFDRVRGVYLTVVAVVREFDGHSDRHARLLSSVAVDHL